MLTEAQLDTLIALNDYCELHGRLLLGDTDGALPDILADLERPDDEVYQAVIIVEGLTARGRQELPSG